MIPMVMLVLGGLAVFAWIIAILAAIQIVRIAPKGRRLPIYGKIGWWRFAEIRSELGTAADPHILVYQRAFTTFLLCVVAAMAIGGIATSLTTPHTAA